MNVVIALEHRYDGTPDGKIWTSGVMAYSFWRRYLDVFDEVHVVARVHRVAAASPGWVRADGSGVCFIPVTYYVGPWQYLQRRHRVLSDVRGAVAPTDAVILRVGSQIAACLESQLRRSARPYAVEVVCDPYDVFSPGSVRHPLRPFFRWWFARQLRRQCAEACAAAYVTEHALQRRYPPGESYSTYDSSVELRNACYVPRPGRVLSTYYSDVDLPETAFARAPRPNSHTDLSIRLIFVGTLEQLYKAPDVLLEAAGQCFREGIDLELVWIGGGMYQPQLEARAKALGLGLRVRFLGQLPTGGAVRDELDRADLFVLPSRQEGLPRAMLEAMARGLSCIGSTVGGIPELLPAEDLVPPGDAVALAAKIREVAGDPERMARMSARNLAKAEEYRDEARHERRLAFYRYVRESTETWIRVARTGRHPVD